MFKLVFSLNCREFERHYCITADSLNRANIPPKRICDPVDLCICLCGLATHVDQWKIRRCFPTGRHTWLEMKNSSTYTRCILKLPFFFFFFYLSDQMRDCYAVLTRLAWHFAVVARWFIMIVARFSPKAVIIKPYCRLKIELTFVDTRNNFLLSGIQFFFCVSFLSITYLLLCAWFIPDVLRIYLLYFCAFF